MLFKIIEISEWKFDQLDVDGDCTVNGLIVFFFIDKGYQATTLWFSLLSALVCFNLIDKITETWGFQGQLPLVGCSQQMQWFSG